MHGAAFAGGMGLVAACDLVVAAEEAEFCLPEVRIGLVPAMISPYIVRAIGEQQARRYVLTGERLPAREAHRLGFVHECVPAAELDARVEQFAAQLAQAGPQALARSKKLLAQVGEGADHAHARRRRPPRCSPRRAPARRRAKASVRSWKSASRAGATARYRQEATMRALFAVAAAVAILCTGAEAKPLRWSSAGDPQTADPYSQNENLTNQLSTASSTTRW